MIVIATAAVWVAVVAPSPASAASLTVSDPVGDSGEWNGPNQWDIVSASLDAPASGVMTLSLRLATWIPPELFTPGSYVSWNLDIDDDGVGEYEVKIEQGRGWPNGPTALEAWVYGWPQPDQDAGCSPTPSWDATTRTYQVALSVHCFDNPPTFRFTAYTWSNFDVNGIPRFTTDFAPQSGGYPYFPAMSAPVRNDAYGSPPPGPPMVAAGHVLKVHVLGQVGVPTSGVAAVSMNVTADRARGEGFVTAYPCDSPRPLASNLNFDIWRGPVANAVIAPVSADGDVCFYVDRSATHLLADVNGWFETGSDFHPLVPSRVFDTRDGTGGVAKGVKLEPGTPLAIDVTGVNGVPADGVAAVSLNVTVTEPRDWGFITVYPCDQPRPWASNVNYWWGQTVPNAVIAPVSADGRVCFYAAESTHLLADVNGWFAAGSTFHGLTPSRVFDTRDGTGGVAVARVDPDHPLIIDVTGSNGVPDAGVAAVALNVTVVWSSSKGYVAVYPCGERPLASSVNWAGFPNTRANAVIAPVSAEGTVCFYASDTTDLLADVSGWFAAGSSFHPVVPTRLFDTRTATVPS